MGDLLTGVCRAAFPWTDNDATLNIAFGTHSKLQVWQGGALYDITPYGAPDRLGSNPLTTTNGTARIDVVHVAHGYTTGQLVKVFGSSAVGGITPNIASVSITVDGVDAYHFTFTSNASSTATGGGGDVVVTPLSELPAGAIDGTGGAGFGTGTYSTGTYSSPSTSEFFPRTWSMGAWGEQLVASPRGGGMYLWANNTAARAVAIDGAPTQVTYSLIAPMNGGYQLFALGTQEEVSGEFNPMCIRHSSVRDLNTWSTLASGSTSREYILPGGGRIVAGRMCGPYMLVWTSDSLFLGSFVGALNQPWKFDRVGRNCGLLGPNAAVIVGQTAYWTSPDLQFFSYGLGGQADPIPCPILKGFMANMAASQGDKVVASSNATFSEVRFDYPDARDGNENSRYLALCISGSDAGAWHKGEMARTAFIDAGPSQYPIATTYEGAVFYQEKGVSADGSAFSWFIETADQYLDVDWRVLVKQVWPDFKDQQGPVTVTVTARETPQGDETAVSADPMAPGDAKADLLVSGRLFKVRFSGESSPTFCLLGKPTFEVDRAGKL